MSVDPSGLAPGAPVAASLAAVGYGLFALQRPVPLEEVASIAVVGAELAAEGHFEPEVETEQGDHGAAVAAALGRWEQAAPAPAAVAAVEPEPAPTPEPEPEAEVEVVDPAREARMAAMLRDISYLDD